MANDESVQEQVAREVEACLKKFGFEPEVRSSRHEALVHARKMIGDECVRVVLHISDREAFSHGSGPAQPEVRAKPVQLAVRPTLAAQTASRTTDTSTSAADRCR